MNTHGLSTNHSNSPITLLLGVIGVAFSVFFFLQKFNIIAMSFEVTDEAYMYFFAVFTFIGGIILLYKATIGSEHHRY